MTGASEAGRDRLTAATEAADGFGIALSDTAAKADGAGSAARKAGAAAKAATEEAATGWRAVTEVLADYARIAMETGQQIGSAMVNAFKGADHALVALAASRKFDFKDPTNSILADVTRIALRLSNTFRAQVSSARPSDGVSGIWRPPSPCPKSPQA